MATKPATPEEDSESQEPVPAKTSLYRFTGPYALTYLDRSLIVEPGKTYEWPDGAPADGHWIEEK